MSGPPVEPAEDDDVFAAAFESLASPGPATVSTPEPVAVPETEPESAAIAEPSGDTKTVVPEPVASEPVASEPVASDPVVPEPVQAVDTSNDDMLRRLAALVKEPAPATTPTPKPSAAPEQVELYTAEEKDILATYEKDWPDVSRAEAIRVQAAVHQAVGHVFSEIAKYVEPFVARVQELSAAEVSRLNDVQLSDIESAVPDYNDVRNKVIEWAGKEPQPYLREAYDRVIKQGTATEVADLVQRYRQATGGALPAPVLVTTPVVLPAATKRAVAALAPVRSIRSVPPAAGADPNDFDSAFEVASSTKRG